MVKEEELMRKLRNLIILLAILIILIASCFFINVSKAKKNKKSASANNMILSQLDNKKIASIDFKTKSSSYTIEKNNSNYSIKNCSYDLDKSTVNSIFNAFSRLTALQVIDKSPLNLDKYGLKSPGSQITVNMNDGKKYVYILGNKVPTGDGYYFKVYDKNIVYMISASTAENFIRKISDLRNKDVVNIDSSDVKYVDISNAGSKEIELKQTGNNIWAMTKPYDNQQNADEGQLSNNVLNPISSIKASDFVEDDAKDLKKYGLDTPKTSIIVKTSKGQTNLIFGNTSSDGSVYFKKSDSSEIYTLDAGIYKSLSGLKPFDLVSKNVYYANADGIDKISISYNGKDYELAIDRSNKKKTVYKLNNNTISESKFQNIYSGLSGLSVDSEIDKKIPENPEIKLTYILNKDGGGGEANISFVPYNSDFYAVFRDGKCDFVISKYQVQKVINSLN